MRFSSAFALFVACLVSLVPAALRADEYQAIAVCRTNGLTLNSYTSATGFAGISTSGPTAVYCPLKFVNCTSGSCVYTADVYSYDNNPGNTDATNVRCELRFHGKNDSTYWTHSASFQTNNSYDALFHKNSLSMTVSSVWAGYVYVYCELGEDYAGGHSILSWIGNTNF